MPGSFPQIVQSQAQSLFEKSITFCEVLQTYDKLIIQELLFVDWKQSQVSCVGLGRVIRYIYSKNKKRKQYYRKEAGPRHLGKSRRSAVCPLKESKRELFGLLRPNGAGKTTTLEMMEGLRKSDSGTILVADESAW